MCATLSGRTALVTGATNGTGAAAARALSGAGAGVVLAAAGGPALDALVAGITAAGGHAAAVPTDLTSAVSVRRLIEQTLGAFGRLDVAINDAGPPAVSLAMTYEIAAMRRAGAGRIVNLAPAGGRRTAVIELTRTMALAVAGSGVRINAVAAGPHDTAESLADTVVCLCSGQAPPATGETFARPRPGAAASSATAGAGH